jgi:hypothetical protein
VCSANSVISSASSLAAYGCLDMSWSDYRVLKSRITAMPECPKYGMSDRLRSRRRGRTLNSHYSKLIGSDHSVEAKPYPNKPFQYIPTTTITTASTLS